MTALVPVFLQDLGFRVTISPQTPNPYYKPYDIWDPVPPENTAMFSDSWQQKLDVPHNLLIYIGL